MKVSRIFLIIAVIAGIKLAGCNNSEPSLVSIAVTTQPSKKTYVVGEEFYMGGMVVTATYSDNSTVPIIISPAMLSYDFTTAGTNKTVTITYEGKTAEVTGITVNEPVPVISSFSPAEAGYDAIITIIGANFSTTASQNIVKFNNTTATVVAASATWLTVIVPKDKICSGKITITVGTESSASTADFIYILTPTVSTPVGSVHPDLIPQGFADGEGTVARFNNPSGVAIDAWGNVFVADRDNNRIRKITPAGVVSTFAGGNGGYGNNNNGLLAQFWCLNDIAFDAAGNLYVADACNGRIRKVTPAGAVSTFAGNGGFGFVDGPSNNAQFRSPEGIAIDAEGNIYVADRSNHSIRKITPEGMVSTLAGSGTAGFANGADAAAQFNEPSGVAVDSDGNVFVADTRNHRIRKITPAGVVSTFAGSGTWGFANGAGATAQFNEPVGVTLDADGNLYVAGGWNHAIRKITPAGVVSTFAGGNKMGFADGAGSVAQFSYPTGVAIDASGNFYVADRGNQRIRKIMME